MAEEKVGSESAEMCNSSSKQMSEGSICKSGKIMTDDVCFDCNGGWFPFAGGELVPCDRGDCCKAYHRVCCRHPKDLYEDPPVYICAWHKCVMCRKNAQFLCYTCPFSRCKRCIRDGTFVCVRGSKGFCRFCIPRVARIENNELENYLVEEGNELTCRKEYNFKGYYMELRDKISLSRSEIAMAKKPSEQDDDSDDPMADAVVVRRRGKPWSYDFTIKNPRGLALRPHKIIHGQELTTVVHDVRTWIHAPTRS